MVAAAQVALAVAVQRHVLMRLGKAAPIGDETGYLECGGRADPFEPGLFLRVPFMAVLSWAANKSARPEIMMRGMSRMASLMTIVVTSLACWLVTGIWVALAVGLALAVMPSRIIYSNKIWPDQYLALWLSALCLLLVWPGIAHHVRAGMIGGVCAVAFLTRFDAVLAAPFSLLALVPADWGAVLFVLGPTALAFAILSIVNRARYGIAWPDNTWAFNLLVSAKEAEIAPGRTPRVEPTVRAAVSEWQRLDRHQQLRQGLGGLLRKPHLLLGGAMRRLVSLAAPDTFALERLLPPSGHAYPEASNSTVGTLRTLLTYEFPILAALALVLIPAFGTSATWLWPTLALVAGSVFMTRTRYRQAWIPGMLLMLADAARRAQLEAPGSTELVILGVAVAGLAAVFSLVRLRKEE